MTVRFLLGLLNFVAYFALLLASGLVALNVVSSWRRAIHGKGRSPIPVLITVLGILALRALSLTLHRPSLFGFWPMLSVIVADLGSWILPPLVCQWLRPAAGWRPAPRPGAASRPAAQPRLPAQPRPAGELRATVPPRLQQRPGSESSPFAKKPPPAADRPPADDPPR